MDKYEFNIKVEQIKKLISEGDYATAMKIADSIDWSRVRNANLLSMVAGVYEKNNDCREAKDILLIAFERAPVGKRLLYKLSELSVKTGEIEDAEDFYREFVDVAPDDLRKFLLEYMIENAKGTPPERLIEPLERFTASEPDEKWLYELAGLYDRAGRRADCIRVCDKIMLLFGLGKYSDKAMDLKMKYAPLTQYQMELMRSMGKREYRQYDENPAYPAYQDNYPSSYSDFRNGEEQGYVGNSFGNYQGDENGYYREPAFEDNYGTGYSDAYEEGTGDGYRKEESYGEGYNSYGGYEEPCENYSQYGDAYDHPEAGDYYSGAAESSDEDELSRKYPDEDKAAEEYLRRCEEILKKMPKKPIAFEENYIGESFEENLGREVKTISAVETTTSRDAGDELSKTRVLDENTKEKLRRIVIREEDEKNPLSGSEKISDGESGLKKNVPEEGVSADASAHTEENEDFAREAEDNKENVSEREPGRAGSENEISDESADSVVSEETESAAPREDIQTFSHGEPYNRFHMMIEAYSPEEGLKIAIEELKYIHTENGIKNSAAKTNAEKLNARGLTDSVVERLRAKDLIVENAGDLNDDILDDICGIIKTDTSGIIVVLIDTPEKLDEIIERNPELANEFDIVSDEYEDGYNESHEDEETGYAPEETYSDRAQAPAYEEEYEEEPYEAENGPYEEAYDEPYEDDGYSEPYDEPDRAYDEEEFDEAQERRKPDREDYSREEEMDIDEFAKYCCQYASGIDCSITGKSMLALYERIELMEEDNIPLTKENAEALIEEAADRAEKPPIGKRLKGMFNSKYDKNGLLILKEEDFIN